MLFSLLLYGSFGFIALLIQKECWHSFNRFVPSLKGTASGNIFNPSSGTAPETARVKCWSLPGVKPEKKKSLPVPQFPSQDKRHLGPSAEWYVWRYRSAWEEPTNLTSYSRGGVKTADYAGSSPFCCRSGIFHSEHCSKESRMGTEAACSGGRI